MNSTDIISLLLVMTTLLGPSCIWSGTAATETCRNSTDVRAMQTMCKDANEGLLKAEQDQNKTKICEEVIGVLKCAADNMTKCYNVFHDMMVLYFQSPFYCTFTQAHVKEIQQIIRSKTTTPPMTSESPSGGSNSINNQSSSSTSSSTASSSSSSSSSSSPSNVMIGDGGDKGYKVDENTKNTGSGTNPEGHTGSDKDSNSSTNLAASVLLVTIVTILSTVMAVTPT